MCVIQQFRWDDDSLIFPPSVQQSFARIGYIGRPLHHMTLVSLRQVHCERRDYQKAQRARCEFQSFSSARNANNVLGC
jgi:hypothetical protein